MSSEPQKQHHEKDLTWLARYARLLKKDRFYGRLELVFKDGRIVHVNKSETIKPH